MKNLAIGQRGQRPGWTTLDAHPRSGATIVAGVPPLPDVVTKYKWDTVEMIHFLEHLFKWQADELLQEIYKVLAPDGELIIECPDIEFAAKVLLGIIEKPRGHQDQFDMWPLYGDPRHRDELYGHKWGYTPKTLTADLIKIGFIDIETMPAQSHFPVRDFRIVARKQGPS